MEIEKKEERRFPPPLTVGNRVSNAALGCGTIIKTEKPNITMDPLLYTITWDKGETTKHYSKGLIGIGRFKSVEEFQAAIKPTGPVHLHAGPRGGFRHARFTVEYDGLQQEVDLRDQDLWKCVQPILQKENLEIIEKREPA